MSEPVLQVSGLVKHFPVGHRGRRRTLVAVDEVGFGVHAGETLALIGESGSGKSTLARCVARLVEPTAGQVRLAGRDLTAIPRRALWRAYTDLQMVFQDPVQSLNPRMTARATVEEPLYLHSSLDKADRARRAVELLAQVGLSPALADRYPRQLSGGECQRVAIARALAVQPKVLLLDEPTASLDVSVRRQILQLLVRLQRERDLGYLFISHDLEVVRQVADRVMVMYLGAIVEQGTAGEIFSRPTHPYTRALLSAATVAEYGRQKVRFRLSGEIPSPLQRSPGCPLSGRCPLAIASCFTTVPERVAVSPTHLVSCPVSTAAGGQPQ
jgi:peptide/nickel transport system ATP-binding protein/oligopeptide transport system ATP-binding protein